MPELAAWCVCERERERVRGEIVKRECRGRERERGIEGRIEGGREGGREWRGGGEEREGRETERHTYTSLMIATSFLPS
jgi:hypothetical protein